MQLPENPTPEQINTMRDLLHEFVDSEQAAPNSGWFPRYFALTGDHMILTDEGWESGAGKAEYEKQAQEDGIPISDLILFETNAPTQP